ncbi:MAG: Uma2 family endonuclease [Candidatus Methylumidiphilus sp.]
MNSPARKLATYEDLFDLPDNLIGEIINGRLITQPRPAPRHVRTHSSLEIEIGGPFDHGKGGPGGWWILIEPELHISGDILVPDLAGWRRERMPRLPDTAWFETVPDWVCEVLSPSTARDDRAEKMPLYAKMGAKHAWLADPILRTLEIYENQQGHWLLLQTLANSAQVVAAPFAAVEWELGVLWAD